MSSLSQRLKELQVPGETAKFDFSHLSLSQLEETKVDFGQAHLGRTYREMWLNHQEWLLWFAGRYEKSGKESHQKILHYVQLMVERAELAGTRIPVHKGVPSSVTPMKPKAKAWPKKLARPPNDVISVWDADETEEFEVYGDEIEAGMSVAAASEGPNSNVAHLETRMLSMENALSQILLMLETIQPATEPQ